MKSAALAWAAPFPAQQSEEQAVVYQFTWNNPGPVFDLEYGDQGRRYVTPALLTHREVKCTGRSRESP